MPESLATRRTQPRRCALCAIAWIALGLTSGPIDWGPVHGGLIRGGYGSAVAQSVAAEESAASEAEIDGLVRQLGATTYRARERAEMRLESLGLLAFEALLDQRDHEDIEIRLRSRRLVEKLRTRFLSEGVEPALEGYLNTYAQRTEDQRELTIGRLADFLPQQSINELARIARFEDRTRISKLAALAIMQVPYPADTQERIHRADRIESSIGFGDRVAVQWLRLYAAALRGEKVDAKPPAQLWESLIEDDKQLTQQEQSDESSLEIVITMHRLLGDFHVLHGDQALAFAARQRVNDGVFGDDEEVFEWMVWLLRRNAWSAVIDLAEKNERRFENQSMLLYGLAEAQLRSGKDQATVAETAQRALAAAPVDEDRERYRSAVFLEDERGMFDWAEKEYRHIIEHGGPESIFRASCFTRLAEMFHAENRGADAYEALNELMKEIEESEIVREVVQERWERDLAALQARMNLYMACHFRDQGDTEKQREYLELATKHDPTEADVLIAMYRVPGADDAWKKKTMRLINNAREQFLRNISDARRASEGAGDEDDSPQSLSEALNQLAWLVSNTEGDYAEALRKSKQSLQLAPGDAGIMDTLGRCYYSVKDFENAVKYQRWALQRSPHEGHIRQQLELFEAALAETKGADLP